MRAIRSFVVAVGVLVTVFATLLRATEVAQNTAVPSSDESERRDQPVTDEDLRILQRADKILVSSAVWNRHDTRICKPTDTTWSLFCALEKASLDVLGEYRHREVALQEVRFAVEDITKGIEFEHRLMDYNNLASTKFEDIKHRSRADAPDSCNRISFLVWGGDVMARDKRLAELARSLHRASERLWLRVTAPAKYQIAEADLAALQKANTDLNRAITKLKMKSKK